MWAKHPEYRILAAMHPLARQLTRATFNLYTVPWPFEFYLKHMNPHDLEPGERFLHILQDLEVPLGTEDKFENTKKYFRFITERADDLGWANQVLKR